MARISRERVRELLDEGRTHTEIAAELRCSVFSISRIKTELGRAGRLDERPGEEPPADDGYDFADDLEAGDIYVEPPAPVVSDRLSEAKIAAQAVRAQVIQARAQLELDKIERERAAMLDPVAPIGRAQPGENQMVAMMAQQLQQAHATNQQLLMRMIDARAAPPVAVAPAIAPAQVSDEAATGLAAILPALRDLLEFADGMRQPPEPMDTTQALIQAAGAAFQAKQQATAHPPAPPELGAGAVPAPPSPSPTPAAFDVVAEGRRRAGVFVETLHREMQIGSDPLAAADGLDPLVGLLPTDLRAAIQTQPLEAILAALGRYVEPAQLEQLVGQVRASVQSATWLGELLAALRDEEEPDEVELGDRFTDPAPPSVPPDEVEPDGNGHDRAE